jgi:hypothetical protein
MPKRDPVQNSNKLGKQMIQNDSGCQTTIGEIDFVDLELMQVA